MGIQYAKYRKELQTVGIKMGRKIITLESRVPYELARMGFVPGTSIEVIQDTWQTNLIRVRCRGATYFMRRETFNQLELEEKDNGI